MSVKGFTFDRHIDLIERVLHHIIRVELVHPSNDDIDVRLMRLREEQEFGARHRLEALQSEVLALEHFEPG